MSDDLHDVDCPMTNPDPQDRTSCICDTEAVSGGARERTEPEGGSLERALSADYVLKIDIVQPPTSPPWVRPEVIQRYLDRDPAVTWESLSSPEQAEVFDRYQQTRDALAVAREDIRVRQAIAEIRERMEQAIGDALITSPEQVRASAQREVASLLGCQPDEIRVDLVDGGRTLTLVLPSFAGPIITGPIKPTL